MWNLKQWKVRERFYCIVTITMLMRENIKLHSVFSRLSIELKLYFFIPLPHCQKHHPWMRKIMPAENQQKKQNRTGIHQIRLCVSVAQLPIETALCSGSCDSPVSAQAVQFQLDFASRQTVGEAAASAGILATTSAIDHSQCDCRRLPLKLWHFWWSTRQTEQLSVSVLDQPY